MKSSSRFRQTGDLFSISILPITIVKITIKRHIRQRGFCTPETCLFPEPQGKFIFVWINDVPEIREIFKDFRVQEVRTSYSVAGA